MKVLKGGIQALVEDWPGRLNYYGKGVGTAGAVDYYALRVGNLLVGNPSGEAGIEILAGFFEAKFEEDAVIALTGANMSTTVNDAPAPMWQSFSVSRGDVIKFRNAKGKGLTCYMTIAGGVDVPSVWGSKSTHLNDLFGGYNGRKLTTGDSISFGKPQTPLKEAVGRKFKKELIPEYTSETVLRATVGPNAAPDYFTEEGIQTFFNRPFQVDNNANRTAYRLRIPKEDFKNIFARKSGGMGGDHPSMTPMQPYRTPGALNIGGDSAAILFVEGVTGGGFLCALSVISADLWKIGQSVPLKSTIEFKFCDPTEAAEILKEQEKIFTLDSLEL